MIVRKEDVLQDILDQIRLSVAEATYFLQRLVQSGLTDQLEIYWTYAPYSSTKAIIYSKEAAQQEFQDGVATVDDTFLCFHQRKLVDSDELIGMLQQGKIDFLPIVLRVTNQEKMDLLKRKIDEALDRRDRYGFMQYTAQLLHLQHPDRHLPFHQDYNIN